LILSSVSDSAIPFSITPSFCNAYIKFALPLPLELKKENCRSGLRKEIVQSEDEEEAKKVSQITLLNSHIENQLFNSVLMILRMKMEADLLQKRTHRKNRR